MNFQFAEPFRIKMVENVKRTTKVERQAWLEEARFNVFKLRAEDVYIDCITDSGTSAMSAEQWAALMRGDESYAGSKSFYRMEASVKDVFGMPYVQPVHQGRAADFMLAKLYTQPGKYALGNMHFDTFRGNAEVAGAKVLDLVVDEGLDAASPAAPFKGNLDLNKLEKAIHKLGRDNITMVMVTVTCNNNGGQPVSMANLKAVGALCQAHQIPMVIDAARLAENVLFY